ncbi:hypothetical protein PUN28_016765 [Cardiocondyla obscurior]|uniref:Uncharacterized protein n=1 Tax=Cardiocondyla obscurior TaxID=286306 RepID=A0AAW2EQB5_9HYME
MREGRLTPSERMTERRRRPRKGILPQRSNPRLKRNFAEVHRLVKVPHADLFIIIRTANVVYLDAFANFQCAEGRLVTTSKLRGGAGSGWASCASGASLSQRQNSTTPLKLMQIGESHHFFSVVFN